MQSKATKLPCAQRKCLTAGGLRAQASQLVQESRELSCSQHAGTCTGIKDITAQNAAFCQKKGMLGTKMRSWNLNISQWEVGSVFPTARDEQISMEDDTFHTSCQTQVRAVCFSSAFSPVSSSPVWWHCQVQTASQSTEQKDENQPHAHQPTAGQGWMPRSSWLQAPGLSLTVAARTCCTWKAWDSRKQVGCNAKANSPRGFGTNFYI